MESEALDDRQSACAESAPTSMTEPETNSDLSPEQQDTVDLLDRHLGRAIADRYVDFCRLASGVFELRVARPVAAHALRELESVLRDTLVVPMEVRPPEGLADPDQLPRAKKLLEEMGFDAAAVGRAAKALEPRANHATQINQIAARLGLAPDGDIAKAWRALVKTFGKAHERSFHRSLDVDDDFRKTFQEPFDTVIRAVVLALRRRYTALMRRVEEIAAMTDKGRAVTLFKQEIPNAMPLQWHFFRRIEAVDWLPHLVKEGVIGPPLSEALAAGGDGSRLREWPAGDYLRRVAESSDPDVRRQVAAAVRNVAASRHPDVSLGGLETIAALPAAEAASLADVASTWLDRDATFMSIQAAEKLVKRLATDGEAAAALTIATRLLQVFDADGEVTSLYAQHMYEYSLPQLAPILTKACGIDALRLLAGLLQQAIVIDHAKNQDAAFDRTAYDQGALEDETAGVHSVYDALRTEVRRSAEALIDADASQVPAIMEVLGKYTPKLFRRLEIYVLARNPAAVPERATALLRDADLIEASWCTHEYAGLARAWFPFMHERDQKAVLDLVDAIPGRNVEGWKQRFEEHEKRPPTAEDERVYNAHVVRDAVWHWRMLLPADRQAAVETAGDPDSWKHSRWMRGEESPLTGSDFATRPAGEIAGFLRTWRSDEEPRRQTVSALALEFRNAVVQDPAKYAQSAMEFADVPAIYVHRLLEGLGEAARNKRDLPWAQILRLIDVTFARWQQPIDPTSIAEGNDPNWQWACAAGVQLLKAGLQRGAEGVPFEHKAAIQSLILALQRRAPRDPEREDFEQQFERDPYFAAESTLRGSAVELCVLLMFWLSKEQGTPLADSPRNALDMSPDIKQAFDAELADRTESGRVPRAILGRYLGWLFYFGEPWLIASAASIFPASDAQQRRAAWLGHLLHDQGPIGELLKILRPDYEHAIDRLGEDAKDREEQGQKRLSDYLLVLYLRGQLDLQPGDLLDQFLRKASPRLRQHAMWWLGVQLKLPLDKFPEELRAKALAYWEARLAAGEAALDRTGFQEELGSIGLWCEHHQLAPDWIFDQMLRLLRAGYAPTSAYSVVEWLAKIVAAHPDRAVEVLEALVANPAADRYLGQENSIRAILTVGHTSGTSATVRRVDEVVSYMASSGQTGYLDVLRPRAA